MNLWQQVRLHLIFAFFGIAGFLARVGIIRLTAHQGLFGGGVIWANCAGCFIMGYLVGHVFVAAGPIQTSAAAPSSQTGTGAPELKPPFGDGRRAEVPAKSEIPLYVGLTTGFCGTFTSLSSAQLELFEIAASTTATIAGGTERGAYGGDFAFPNAGYGVPAGLAYAIITCSVSIASFQAGRHLAAAPYIKALTLTPRGLLFVELVLSALGAAAWIIVFVLAIVSGVTTSVTTTSGDGVLLTSSSALSPAARYWALGMVFSPVAVYTRYWVSRLLNPTFPRKFPLGTFACNMLATLVLAVLAVLQYGAPITVLMAGGISCQVISALADGFCATLSTVSTLVSELHSLRLKYSYIYGLSSVFGPFCLMVLIFGSYIWTNSYHASVC